jgi:Na+/H+ antiporter NhaD/arsenite permease-like protein
LIALGRIDAHAAWAAIDVGTIALLFGMMVVSAALQRAGFYDRTVARIAALDTSPMQLLGLVILAAGALSAVLTNDVVCIAMAPLVIQTAASRGLAPLPYLLGLACAANVGSAATLIGNPQNMLIGQSLRLDFGAYLADAALPSALGLVVTWAVIAAVQRGRWAADVAPPPTSARPYDRFDATKTLLVLAIVVALFLATDWPREVVALGAAGVVLVSRRSRSRDVLTLVDWQLLVLFAGLFVVNATLESSGMLAQFVAAARARGVDPADPATLFLVTVPLSNLVSNVPAIMLLLPTATHPQAGVVLALAGTLAGNLFLVGSIANLIVADQAARLGVRVSAREHARVGVPVALVTLALAGAWLALRGN